MDLIGLDNRYRSNTNGTHILPETNQHNNCTGLRYWPLTVHSLLSWKILWKHD